MRTVLGQYRYETQERGLNHKDALDQMKWMFTAAELEELDKMHKEGKI